MGKDMKNSLFTSNTIEHCKKTLLSDDVIRMVLQKKHKGKLIFGIDDKEINKKDKMETIITNLFNIILINFYLDYDLKDIISLLNNNKKRNT